MNEQTNPFLADTLFVGRQEEAKAIRDHLQAGKSTLLIGGRRTGKTVLSARIADVGRRIVIADAGAWDIRSEEAVIRALGEAIDRATGSNRSNRDYSRQEFAERLRTVAPLAIIVDEADRILSEPWAGSFLSYLRWLDDRELRSLVAFLLIGGPRLAEYRNPDDHGSPPLNTAEPVYLEPLKLTHVSELARAIPQDVDVNEVFRWAGGHPWLLNRILSQLWDGKQLEAALDHVLDISFPNFGVWRRQVGVDGSSFLRSLPPTGISMAEFRKGKMAKHRQALLKCRYTCLVKRTSDVIQPGPKIFLDWFNEETGASESWDLAISYASEDEKLARAIYEQLSADIKVFFAPAQNAYLWGNPLSKVLPQTYGTDCRFILVLCSESYIRKHWTMVEYKAASDSLGAGRILVVSLGTLPPDMPPDVVYKDADPANLVGLASSIRRKLRSG